MTPYYQDAAVTIYHGDCRVIVPQLGKFDLLLTDPPYGIGASRGTGEYGKLKWLNGDKKWDRVPLANWILEMLVESAQSHIIWGGITIPYRRHGNI